MKNLGVFVLLFALAFTACRKNESDIIVDTTVPDPTFLNNYVPTYSQVNGDLTGLIVNVNDVPIENVQVKLGAFTTTTDQFGHFFFTNMEMNAAGTVVQVEKEGYFTGSRRFNAVEGVENRVKIQLINKVFNQTFESQEGGTIEITQGVTIDFAPNTIQDAAGNPYNGQVKVASTWLTPSRTVSLTQMPGNLFGVNNQGEEVVLGTYGMIAAELESDTGEPLNILEGESATITTIVPESMQANAPAEIPLWSYNEEFGVWVEEGISILQNGSYVAEVTHFSFWNHDFPADLVEFTAIITNEDGIALENYLVTIRELGTVFYGYGYTCEGGIVTGYIPKDKELEIEIRAVCGELIYTMDIGPFSTDTDLGTIVVTDPLLESTTVSGELVDCDGVSIQNGLVVLQSSAGTAYEYVSGAPFDVTFTACWTGDVEVTGYDLDNDVQSTPQTATGGTTTDLGDINVCDVQLQNYLSFTVDGVNEVYIINMNPDSNWVGSTHTTFQTLQTSTVPYLKCSFPGNMGGDYSAEFIKFSLADATHNWLFSNINGVYFNTFEVTEFGLVGEPISGFFEGMLENEATPPPTPVTVSGEFSFIRDY